MRAFKHVDPSILLPSFLSFYRSVISEEVRPPSFFEPTTLFSFIPRNSLEHNKIRFSGRIRIHRCFTRTRILWFFAILLSITMVLANMTYTNNIAGGRQYVRALVHITDINNSGVFFNAILVLIPVIPVIHVSLDALNVRAAAACASTDKMGYEIPLSLAGYGVFIRKNRTTFPNMYVSIKLLLFLCVIPGAVRMYRFIGLFSSDRTSSSASSSSFSYISIAGCERWLQFRAI